MKHQRVLPLTVKAKGEDGGELGRTEEDRQMENFATRDNICHYLNLLWSDSASVEDRADINKLIIEEANKLNQDAPALEFLENRADSYRRRFGQICRWRDGFVEGSSERAKAERVVEKFETTLRAMDGCCIQMRQQLIGQAHYRMSA
jgi:hypothetical protein